jgi:pimeloyl-ACP methyl ester carboxylesterase
VKEREYSTGRVRSADGTTIGYRRCGRGPGLILLHGGMLAAQHFMKLAAALAADRSPGRTGSFGSCLTDFRPCTGGR